MSSLFVGCGNSVARQIEPPGSEPGEIVTLDVSSACDPDVVWDLNELPYPFRDYQFAEIHAYEVLEHCGSQGDERFFFAQFDEFHRILKPGGYFCGSVPLPGSVWAFGDPGHKRVLPSQVFSFLTEAHYSQVGETALADYRDLITRFWTIEGLREHGERLFFLLRS